MASRNPAFADNPTDQHNEMELVRTVLAELIDGRSAVLVVEGPPGLGRTSFARGADAIAAAAGITVVHATGAAGESETQLGVVAQFMAPLLPSDSPLWNVLRAGGDERAVGLLLECGRQLRAKRADNPAVLGWRSSAVRALRACGRTEQADDLLATEHRLALAWGAPSVLARVDRLKGR